ncbi:hypothetical protein ACJX0J_038543, partial [Zea mays]
MDTSSPEALVDAKNLNMFVGQRMCAVVQSSNGHRLSVESAMDVHVSYCMEVYGIAENNQTIHAEPCTDFGPNF